MDREELPVAMHENSPDNFAHALEVLELPSILELIAADCFNAGAAERIRGIRPSTNPSEISQSLREIESMRGFMIKEGDFPIADTIFLGAVDEAVKLGKVMMPKMLLLLVSLERTIIELKKRCKSRDKEDPVSKLVDGFFIHRTVIARIEKAVDSEGKISSRASSTLGSLRNKINAIRENLRNNAEKLASGYGKDAYATVIEGRFKLLVPQDRFKRAKGILHSRSHSGQSVYFEPWDIVEANNDLELLLREEKEEEARILKDLSNAVVEVADEVRENVSIMEQLDMLKAKSIFASRWQCTSPAFSKRGVLRLAKARHPLLEESLREEGRIDELVPLEIEIKPENPVVVITGPNAGGKTVVLRTVGLCILLFQSGLQIPCDLSTEIPVFEAVYADIGDEQSIASSLSTFTSHISHLDMMCRNASLRTLCLIDEIGDGTDPEEGAAIACAALSKLKEMGAMVVATTHYDKVKTFALRESGMSNASMLFDEGIEKPLYILAQGLPGRSRGIETAKRFGLDEEVVNLAIELLGKEAFHLDEILAQLEKDKRDLTRKKMEFEEKSRELSEIISLYMQRNLALKQLEATQAERAERETAELVKSARREIERIVKSIRESEAEKKIVKESHERLRTLARRTESSRAIRRLHGHSEKGEWKLGDTAALSEHGSPAGTIVELQNKTATVEINGKRIKIRIESLFKVDAESQREQGGIDYEVEFEPLGSTAIDVRGRNRPAALEAVDRFLDRAILSGVHQVTIVHGVGEGILLRAIHESLRADPRVKSFRAGRAGEGGSGASIVELV